MTDTLLTRENSAERKLADLLNQYEDSNVAALQEPTVPVVAQPPKSAVLVAAPQPHFQQQNLSCPPCPPSFASRHKFLVGFIMLLALAGLVWLIYWYLHKRPKATPAAAAPATASVPTTPATVAPTSTPATSSGSTTTQADYIITMYAKQGDVQHTSDLWSYLVQALQQQQKMGKVSFRIVFCENSNSLACQSVVIDGQRGVPERSYPSQPVITFKFAGKQDEIRLDSLFTNALASSAGGSPSAAASNIVRDLNSIMMQN